MVRLIATVLCLILLSNEVTIRAEKLDTAVISVDSIVLDDIVITAEKIYRPVTGGMLDKINLDIKNMQFLPQFMGTVDLLKTIQLMPGVQTSGEMNSGIYIRGGDSAHNRFLVNGATLYNPSHLLGFFSVFNSAHVNSASIMKSFIPVEYGGQLSSVIEVNCDVENVKQVEVDGSLGVIASQLSLATPLGKKGSMRISGRKTYINALLNMFIKDNSRYKPQYDFQDYNLTYTLRPNYKNTISINGYIGLDDLSMNEYYYQANGGSGWMNGAASVRWDYNKSERIRLENILHTSFYKNNLWVEFGGGEMNMDSRINDFGYRGKIDIFLDKVNLKAGLDFASHRVLPQYPGMNTLLGANYVQIRPGVMCMNEGAVFTQGLIKISDKINSNIGFRYSLAAYNNDKKGIYHGFEPKFNVEYFYNGNTRFSASFTTQKQYMNQVMVSGIGMPTDFWLPVSEYIPPQTSYNFSAGFYKSMLNNVLEINLDLYFRKFDNQLEFDGELFNVLNDTYHIDEHILYGKGYSYGFEVLLKYNKRKFNGWVSYTLGKSDRIFPDINNGKPFPAKNDRRHDLSVACNYRLNNRWDFSSVFVLATGNAYTMPVAIYIIGDNMVNEYGPYNGARMPLYNRMDVSATYHFKPRGKVRHSINASLYNCYGRNNPAFIHIRTNIYDKENIRIQPVGASLYSVVPSISYILKY